MKGYWDAFVKFIGDLFHSFYTNDKGVSARKISACVAVLVCLRVTISNTTNENLESVLQVWLLYSLLCLGLVTFGQILQVKSGVSTSIEKTSIEVTKTESTDGK